MLYPHRPSILVRNIKLVSRSGESRGNNGTAANTTLWFIDQWLAIIVSSLDLKASLFSLYIYAYPLETLSSSLGVEDAFTLNIPSLTLFLSLTLLISLECIHPHTPFRWVEIATFRRETPKLFDSVICDCSLLREWTNTLLW